MYWGLSEGLDLAQKYYQHNKSGPHVESLNILVYGSGAIRHILRTVAANSISSRPIDLNFLILDGCADFVARNLLLLDVAFSSADLCLLTRTHLFMDIYGNVRLRPCSWQYQMQRTPILMDFITDPVWGLHNYSSMLDISLLKYRDRDWIESIFKYWRSLGDSPDMAKQWDNGLRQYLGSRYDYRNGAFDWDLLMELKDRGASQICKQEYLGYRNKGIAFEFPEFEYSYDNKSMLLQAVKSGSMKRLQFMGDMHTGPFTSFGINCGVIEEKPKHDECDFRATDITEHNLAKIFHQIHKKEPLRDDFIRGHKLGLAQFKSGRTYESIEKSSIVLPERSEHTPMIALDNVKIKFMSPDNLKNFSHPEMQNKFDVAFIGASYFPFLKEEFRECMLHNGIIIFETLQLSLLSKEKRDTFASSIKEFAKRKCNFNLMTNFNLNQQYTSYDYKKE